MRRLVLCSLCAFGALALSCQVFQGPVPTATSHAEASPAWLPTVDAAPPQQDLAETLAWVEGRGTTRHEPTAPVDPEVRHVVAQLSERHTGLSRREIRAVARTLVEKAREAEIEVNLVLAVIAVESAGYHRAVSPVGALGLMQIMPATGEQLAAQHGVEWQGPATLFDPIVNVTLGIAYLRELSARYDHVPTALAAYNWGPGRIDSRIRRGARMPQLYVEQVQKAIDKVAEAGRASS